MTTMVMPDWFNEWVEVDKEGRGTYLKENAPDNIKQKYREYKKQIEEGMMSIED